MALICYGSLVDLAIPIRISGGASSYLNGGHLTYIKDVAGPVQELMCTRQYEDR